MISSVAYRDGRHDRYNVRRPPSFHSEPLFFLSLLKALRAMRDDALPSYFAVSNEHSDSLGGGGAKTAA